MNRNLIEIASWSFAAELVRQSPTELALIEMHPGDGLYDCLSVTANQKLLCHFNRNGSLTFVKTIEGRLIEAPQIDIWELLSSQENPRELLNRVCRTLGITMPAPLPPGTPRSLTYRTIAAFLKTTAFGVDQWRCVNGYLDTSGVGGGVIADFDQFPQAKRRLSDRLESDLLREPAYRFWFLQRDGRSVVCFEDTGCAWLRDGSAFQLMEVYRPDRSLADIVARIAIGIGQS